MIITVIATRFGDENGKPTQAHSAKDEKAAAAEAEVAPPTDNASSLSSSDDDAFTDIVSFFKK